MKKQLVSLILAAVMTFSYNSTAAFAIDMQTKDVKNNVVCLSQTFDQDIVEKLENSCLAYLTQDDGTTTPLNCAITIKEIPNPKSNLRDTLNTKTYSINVIASSEQKYESNSGDYNRGSINATANITMIWTDVLGAENTMDQLYGDVSFLDGTFKKGRVQWGATATGIFDREITSDSFDIEPNYTGRTLYAEFNVEAKELSGYFMTVSVKPSIFD